MSTSMIRRINLSHKKLNISAAMEERCYSRFGDKEAREVVDMGMGGEGERGRARGLRGR